MMQAAEFGASIDKISGHDTPGMTLFSAMR
jgi:hypothetical protein